LPPARAGSPRSTSAGPTTRPSASCSPPGYPDAPKKNLVISGLDAAAKQPHAHVLHAGTARNADGAIVTAGGRVLNVVATGPDRATAAARAYAAADLITFEGKQMRRDIGVAGVSG
jgi:phosphoribosylamine--glycine ligase